MYETPKLVRYGSFRELTLVPQGCMTQAPWTGKDQPTFDPLFPNGQNDGCPPRS